MYILCALKMRIEKLAFSSFFSCIDIHPFPFHATLLYYWIRRKRKGRELEQLMCDVYFLVVGAVLHILGVQRYV